MLYSFFRLLKWCYNKICIPQISSKIITNVITDTPVKKSIWELPVPQKRLSDLFQLDTPPSQDYLNYIARFFPEEQLERRKPIRVESGYSQIPNNVQTINDELTNDADGLQIESNDIDNNILHEHRPLNNGPTNNYRRTNIMLEDK